MVTVGFGSLLILKELVDLYRNIVVVKFDFLEVQIVAGNNIDTTVEKIKDEVARVIFYSPDNNYCVLKMDYELFDEKIIAVGYLFELEIHDRYELEGEFIEDPEYGL